MRSRLRFLSSSLSLNLSLSLAIALSGALATAQGVPYPYSVTLNWSPTAASTGQNIYRAPYSTSCGTFAKLNASPISATVATYSDTTVVPNAGYCYEVTSLNGTAESGPSNIVSNIQIPPAPPTGLTGIAQ